MKIRLILIAVSLAIVCGMVGKAAAGEVNVLMKAGADGLKEFYLAVGDYYKAPEKDVVVIHDRGIPDDEIPVVYFIARRANVEPSAIIKLRLGGESWMAISLHYGLAADVYYVAYKGDPGPPYGKAYGYYHKRPRKEWREIRLADADIVNLVNLRFLSTHYGYSPDEIMKMRSGGENFVKINGKVKAAKGKGQSKKATTVKSASSAEKGKSKKETAVKSTSPGGKSKTEKK